MRKESLINQEKVKDGKLQGREWIPTTPLPYEFIMIDEKRETD